MNTPFSTCPSLWSRIKTTILPNFFPVNGLGTLVSIVVPRRVKCASAHLAKYCLKQKKDNPKYVNCKGTHTANFKIFSTFIETKASRHPNRPNTTAPNRSTNFCSLVQSTDFTSSETKTLHLTYVSTVSNSTPGSHNQ